jgi:hypothetical protein
MAGTVRTPETNNYFISGVSFSAIAEKPNVGGLFSHSLDFLLLFG